MTWNKIPAKRISPRNIQGQQNVSGIGGVNLAAQPIRASGQLNATVVLRANDDLNGLLTIDGVSVATGNFVLVTAQTDQTENGLYQASSGAWIRQPIPTGGIITILKGTTYKGSIWQLVGAPVIGTDNVQIRLVYPFTGHVNVVDGVTLIQKEAITDQAGTAVAGNDSFLFSDADDGGNLKSGSAFSIVDTITGQVDVNGSGVATIISSGLTPVLPQYQDFAVISDNSDLGNTKRSNIGEILAIQAGDVNVSNTGVTTAQRQIITGQSLLSPLSGPELVFIDDGTSLRNTTAQDIANLAGGVFTPKAIAVRQDVISTTAETVSIQVDFAANEFLDGMLFTIFGAIYVLQNTGVNRTPTVRTKIAGTTRHSIANVVNTSATEARAYRGHSLVRIGTTLYSLSGDINANAVGYSGTFNSNSAWIAIASFNFATSWSLQVTVQPDFNSANYYYKPQLQKAYYRQP